MQLTVGISEMRVSNNPSDVLITYSLGSCIGVAFYDETVHIGALIHCMLPLSRIDPQRALITPCMFADTGVPLALQTMLDMGAEKRRIVAKVAGAAKLLDDNDTFRIGERNWIVLRKILWKNNILIAAEDTGGSIARTMLLDIATGKTSIKSRGKQYDLG